MYVCVHIYIYIHIHIHIYMYIHSYISATTNYIKSIDGHIDCTLPSLTVNQCQYPIAENAECGCALQIESG